MGRGASSGDVIHSHGSIKDNVNCPLVVEPQLVKLRRSDTDDIKGGIGIVGLRVGLLHAVALTPDVLNRQVKAEASLELFCEQEVGSGNLNLQSVSSLINGVLLDVTGHVNTVFGQLNGIFYWTALLSGNHRASAVVSQQKAHLHLGERIRGDDTEGVARLSDLDLVLEHSDGLSSSILVHALLVEPVVIRAKNHTLPLDSGIVAKVEVGGSALTSLLKLLICALNRVLSETKWLDHHSNVHSRAALLLVLIDVRLSIDATPLIVSVDSSFVRHRVLVRSARSTMLELKLQFERSLGPVLDLGSVEDGYLLSHFGESIEAIVVSVGGEDLILLVVQDSVPHQSASPDSVDKESQDHGLRNQEEALRRGDFTVALDESIPGGPPQDAILQLLRVSFVVMLARFVEVNRQSMRQALTVDDIIVNLETPTLAVGILEQWILALAALVSSVMSKTSVTVADGMFASLLTSPVPIAVHRSSVRLAFASWNAVASG